MNRGNQYIVDGLTDELNGKICHNCATPSGFPTHENTKKGENGQVILSGCNPGTEMAPGELIKIPFSYDFYQIEAISRKDHSGKFSNEIMKKDSHFTAVCSHIIMS